MTTGSVRPRAVSNGAPMAFLRADVASDTGGDEMYEVVNHDRVPVMTIDYAHLVMQAHIDCLLCVCAVKRQAKSRLVESKRLVPDSSRG
ncbi:hypothetical protein [Nocardia nova]|uniref:hypothetical protein n=1 Tax=Nocardia nova TaxID=37330 RepID=UPI0033ED8DCD